MNEVKMSSCSFACMTLFLTSVLIIVAPRSTVIVLIVLSAWRLYEFRSGRMVLNPAWSFIIPLALFTFWSGLTLAWVDVPADSIRAYAEFVALGLIGLIAFSIQPVSVESQSPLLERYALLGAALGLFIVFIALLYAWIFDDSLWGSYYFDPLTVLNSSSVILALMFWPTLRVIKLRTRINPWLVGVPCFALMLLLSSMAAVVAVVIGGILLLMWRLIGSRTAIACGVLAAILTLAAPSSMTWGGIDYFDNPETVNAPSSLPYSIRHRLAMWSFAIEKINDHPLAGWGMGMSRYIPKEDRRLLPNMEIMPLHPHSIVLQTRLELGVPGAVLLATLIFMVFFSISRHPDLRNSPLGGAALASACAWFFIANVSYGMWQSWWLASAFILASMLRYEATRTG